MGSFRTEAWEARMDTYYGERDGDQIECPLCPWMDRRAELEEHCRLVHRVTLREAYLQRPDSDPEDNCIKDFIEGKDISMPTITNYRDCEIRISQHAESNTYSAVVYGDMWKLDAGYYGDKTEAFNMAVSLIDKLMVDKVPKTFAEQVGMESNKIRKVMLVKFIDQLFERMLDSYDNSSALDTLEDIRQIALAKLEGWERK